MADVTVPVSTTTAGEAEGNPVRRFLRATEIDVRPVGMVAALVGIWVIFHVLSAWRSSPPGTFNWQAGVFLTPRNLWNISVQTASIAVMATGMVLVIVTRNIDLSVGSILGFVGMIMAVVQVQILPQYLGFGHPLIWIIAVLAGILAGMAIGGVHGFLIAFLGIPSFIVTLGGLLVWRGAAWWITSGRTVAPMDTRYKLLGGGPEGALGANLTWLIGIVACILVVGGLALARNRRRRFKFPRRPLWAEALLAFVGCALIIGFVILVNSYPWPVGIVRRYAQANNITIPEGGLFISHGIAIPVLIALGVAVVMTFITRRTRFGRYVFAIGGNPEAAELGGINTRWVTMKVFMLMGALVGIASTIATARLDAATNNTGSLDELYTIAAAVIGGTSLGGGVGTIAGAVLGAVLMQSLQSGMVLMGLETPLQQMIVGVVLVLAVLLDTIYRKRAGA